jgi:hypothetical protein
MVAEIVAYTIFFFAVIGVIVTLGFGTEAFRFWLEMRKMRKQIAGRPADD